MVTVRRRIKELSRQENRRRTFFVRLAENYDGIGQYIRVALSDASVNVAYKARIASADFGTGQIIPAGTQVTVVSYRGQLEIISMGAK